MNKVFKQFALVAVILTTSGTALYLQSKSGSQHQSTEMQQYHLAQEKQVQRLKQRNERIENGVLIPESGEGSVYYNEETGKNVITTTNGAIIIE